MVRKLKYHEQKLLKKVDFINWEVDNNLHEVKVLRKYHIEKREDYTKYNKLSRNIRDLAQKIRDLNEKDGFRAQSTHQLLEKLYSIGLIPTRQNLSLTDKVTASAFCRRRLPSIMLNLRMAQNLKTAITFIEQGHVRVGPDIVTDPAFLVTRNMEDFVTWVDSSKIKQHVMNYNDEVSFQNLPMCYLIVAVACSLERMTLSPVININIDR
uniref:U3 small nucleolar ribonucleoprotein protein IMP3 n=1 Tax=Mastacembelus armatus TaxID=205130 RepID=A0A7N8X6F4_9TELE